VIRGRDLGGLMIDESSCLQWRIFSEVSASMNQKTRKGFLLEPEAKPYVRWRYEWRCSGGKNPCGWRYLLILAARSQQYSKVADGGDL
jgi:hypothetical protein